MEADQYIKFHVLNVICFIKYALDSNGEVELETNLRNSNHYLFNQEAKNLKIPYSVKHS